MPLYYAPMSNIPKYIISFVFILLFPFPASAATIVTDTYIDNTETWDLARSPFVIPNSAGADIMITASGTLNIEAGVVIKVNGARKFDVYGVLNILGQAGQEVVMTAYDDDDSDTPPIFVSNRWGGFVFYPGSTGNLNHLRVKYTGFVQFPPGASALLNLGGHLNIVNSNFLNNYQVLSQKLGTTTVTNTLFDKSVTAITHEGGTLSLADSAISNSAGQSFLSYGGAYQFYSENNTFLNNRYNPFLILSMHFDIASTTFIGGDTAAWRIGGAVTANKTLPPAIYALNGVIVESGGTLTVSPGAILKAERDGYLIARGGVLNMNGAENNPVIFTSIADDSVGGDTNNDANATSGYQFKTGGVQVETGGAANISNTLIKYASGSSYIGPYNPAIGALINMGGALNANHVIIEEGNHTGIHHYNGTTTIENLLIRSGSYNSALIYDFGNLNVHQSSFQGYTSYYSLWNRENLGVPDIRFNYWGTPEGPYHPTQNATGTAPMIYGAALFIPWLTSPPATTTQIEPVIIIPGIMGSELYNGSDLVWLDLEQMFVDINDQFLTENLSLDINGNSTINITTGDIIYEIANINSFKDLIIDLENNDYEKNVSYFVFPYDWRLNLDNTKDLLKQKFMKERGKRAK